MGGHIVRLAWNTTTGAWSVVSPHVDNGVNFVLHHTNKVWTATSGIIKRYFPKTHGMLSEGAKNILDAASKSINHVRSRVDGMDIRPQFLRPKIGEV